MRKTLKTISLLLFSSLFMLFGVACLNQGGNSSENEPTIKIELSASTLNVDLYGQAELEATVYKDNVISEEVVTWSSSDNEVIELIEGENALTIKGIKVGNATVTAKVGEVEATCECIVEAKPQQVPKLVMNTYDVSININDTLTLIPTVYYDGIAVTEELQYTYSVEDETIASTTNGVVTGKALGQTKVYVTTSYKDVDLSATVEVEVKTSTVLLLNKKELYFYRLAPGYDKFTEEISVEIVPQDGYNVDYSELVWESSDEEIIKIIDVKNGKCTVENGKAGEATVTVSYNAPEGVLLQESVEVVVESSGVEYAEHPTLDLSGLKMSLNDGEKFTYPKAIDFSGKGINDTLVNLITIPTEELKRDVSALYISFTDTEDETNSVTIRVTKHHVESWDFCYAFVQFSQCTPDYWYGYTNERDGNCGMWLGGDINGSKNIRISMDYAERIVYSWNQAQTSMAMIADLDDSTHFPDKAWSGFAEDKAYVSVWTTGHVKANLQSTLLITDISDYNLEDPTKEKEDATFESKSEYVTDYKVDIPEGQAYRLGSIDDCGTSYSNGATMPTGNRVWSGWEDSQTSLNLGNGLLVTSAGKLNTNDDSYSTRWTYSKLIDLNGKTKTDTLLDMMTLPQTALTRESASINIYLTDKEDTSNYIKIRITAHHQYNIPMMHVSFSKYPTINHWVGLNENGDQNIGSWFVGDWNGTSNIMLSFDYEEKAIYAFKHTPEDYNFDKMFKVADLDDATFFPDGQWEGFTNGTCYLSVGYEYVNTENHQVQFFVRNILGCDLAPVTKEEN